MVTPELAECIAAALTPDDGEVFLVSDVRWLAQEMRDIFLDSGSFRLHDLHATAGAPTGWGEPPAGSPTDGGGDSGGDGGGGGGAGDRGGCGGDDGEDGQQEQGGAQREVRGAAGEGTGAGHAGRKEEDNWLRLRPYGVPTERDKVCEAKWRAVYRVLLLRI